MFVTFVFWRYIDVCITSLLKYSARWEKKTAKPTHQCLKTYNRILDDWRENKKRAQFHTVNVCTMWMCLCLYLFVRMDKCEHCSPSFPIIVETNTKPNQAHSEFEWTNVSGKERRRRRKRQKREIAIDRKRPEKEWQRATSFATTHARTSKGNIKQQNSRASKQKQRYTLNHQQKYSCCCNWNTKQQNL